MPIYEFSCQDCGHEFEIIQSFSDNRTPSCPNCLGVHVQRRLSSPAIHFKGSGWYITDSKGSSKDSSTGAKNGEPTSKPGADKTDSKEKATEPAPAAPPKESSKPESTAKQD